MATVGVIGGGISGLAAAYYLTKLGKGAVNKVFLIEASNNVGGWIKSTRFEDGTVFENGPRSVRFAGNTGQNLLDMVEDLQLESSLLPITTRHPCASKRMLLVNDKLHILPFASAIFKTTPPFSKPLLFCGVRDLFKRRKTSVDDNLYDFAERRFGNEVAELVIDSVCRGVYAGNARKLSVKTLAKDMFDAEQKYGSVLLGFGRVKKTAGQGKSSPLGVLSQKAKDARWTMWNLQGGLQSLVDRLKNKLEDEKVCIHLSSPVTKLDFENQKSKIIAKNDVLFECDHVISALPASNLGSILDRNMLPAIELLNNIESVSVAVVNLEYEGAPGKILPMPGFGFLVPSRENVPILGIVFDSCVFPEHDAGKNDRTRLTVMLGGYWFPQLFGDPEKVKESQLFDIAVDSVKKFLGISQPVLRSQVHVHKNCIPQYQVGHFERLDTLRQLSSKLPLSLIGASFDGVSVADCVYHAKVQVEKFLNK